MTATAVAFVPSAPLLVTAVAGGSAAHDETMRTAARSACRSAVERVEAVVVIAACDHPGHWDQKATWDFHGFGVGNVPAGEHETLPWPLGIGAWLLDEVEYAGPRHYVAVSASDPPDRIDAPAERVGIVAVGDGTARRSEKAPGHLDDRAFGFDAQIAVAMAAGDVQALADLDPALAEELMCAGAPVWRVLARWLQGCSVSSATLLHESAPYGVGYFVAAWSLQDGGSGSEGR